jgi:exonuclease SbcC
VYDALEVLQGIGGKAGLVGIISHVDALAETIPARIEITKGRRGSSAKILGA